MCVKFSTFENSNCFPFNKYEIITQEGKKELIWGDKELKKIHVRIEDFDSSEYEKGILITNGFYVFKKDKRIAPIGFGDHKESIKLTEILVNVKGKDELLFPVAIKNDRFYILITQASEIIKEFQPNEPLIVDNVSEWFGNKTDSTIQKRDFNLVFN